MSAPDPQGRLAEAVEGLYDVFSRYPLAPRVEGCPCCVSASDMDRLHSQPLRRLTAEDLSRYARKAISTWGTVEDFKHFLPRILELVTAEESITDEIDAEVLFGKFTYAKWQLWTAQEQKAVRDYLGALWLYLLSLSPELISMDDFLCAYGQAVDDLTPYLEAWSNTRTPFSLQHYFDLMSRNEAQLPKRRLCNSFWPGREEQMRQVADWATSSETEEKMARMLYL